MISLSLCYRNNVCARPTPDGRGRGGGVAARLFLQQFFYFLQLPQWRSRQQVTTATPFRLKLSTAYNTTYNRHNRCIVCFDALQPSLPFINFSTCLSGLRLQIFSVRRILAAGCSCAHFKKSAQVRR